MLDEDGTRSKEVLDVLNDVLNRLELAEDSLVELSETNDGRPARPKLVCLEVNESYEKLIGQNVVSKKRKFDCTGPEIDEFSNRSPNSNAKVLRLDDSSAEDLVDDDDIVQISEVRCFVID